MCVLAVLVAASLVVCVFYYCRTYYKAVRVVGSAQALYSCTSDSQCKYEGCNGNPCLLSSLGDESRCITFEKVGCGCINGKWKASCYSTTQKPFCVAYGGTLPHCPDPPPCPNGTFSCTGKNEEGA
jgi:hypothetical protein